MNIYVCAKHVPDSAATIEIIGDNKINEKITFLLNPYDEHAVTEAVKLKRQLKDAEVVVVCLGKTDAQKTLGSALAMGADRGILIASDIQKDSIVTAQALKAAIQNDGSPAMILTGKESIDSEGMQIMFRLASGFDYPVATNVVNLSMASGKVLATCETEGGAQDLYRLSMPCIIGAGKGLNTPKYPTLPDIIKARKKEIKTIGIETLDLDQVPASMNIVTLRPSVEKREPKEIKGDVKTVAAKLLKVLREEIKVI